MPEEPEPQELSQEASGEEEETPEGELVEVFDTREESEALVVRGLLESAGIPALVSAVDATQLVYPGVGGVQVRVAPDQAEEARRVIEASRAVAEGLPPLSDDSETPA